MARKYRHVAWYSLFVAAYMVVLYLQADAYKSSDVVATLKGKCFSSLSHSLLTSHSRLSMQMHSLHRAVMESPQ